MAVWADLDEDDDSSSLAPNQLTTAITLQPSEYLPDHDRPTAYVAHALRCYPIAEKLSSYLDLTDLDSLSSTCHSVHDSLVQFAHQLKQCSLRCTFDTQRRKQPVDYEAQDAALALSLSFEEQLDFGLNPALPASFDSPGYSPFQSQSSLGLSGKIAKCARDLVAPCRKCGTIVCRNCIEKAPTHKLLAGRLRRLCDVCISAPLILHEAPFHETEQSVASSSSSTCSGRSDSGASDTEREVDIQHTSQTLSELPKMWLRGPCSCASKGIYLCHACGHSNAADDITNHRCWKWRSKYSTGLGGSMGVGLGLGNQGQKCGRGKYCLATRDVMVLMESECEDMSTPLSHELSRSGTPVTGEERPEPGYFRQEIEGIGGNLKSKSKKLVKVGATVYEFRDERESGKYLGREANGALRAWCSWCSRVCPGKQDQEERGEPKDEACA